jgi:hypothetical protein
LPQQQVVVIRRFSNPEEFAATRQIEGKAE